MVAKASGRTWAVATITGTAALRAAATVLGFAGNRVEVPKAAFPAAQNVFRQLGCEIEISNYSGWFHDAQHYAGWPPGQRIGRSATAMLSDRAPAIGEEPDTLNALECYSFAANKIVTCGHGGAIVGDDKDLRHMVREAVQQGYGRDGMFNYRMADINAAIGCAQMERLDELKDAKRRIWQRYADAGIEMIDRGPSRWMATANFNGISETNLQEQAIACRKEPSGGVSLPCSTGLTEEQQDTVIKVVESLSSLRAERTGVHSRPSSTVFMGDAGCGSSA